MGGLTATEIVILIVRLFPELLEIPIAGRFLRGFVGLPVDETKAVEDLNRALDLAKKTRQKIKDESKHQLVKVSDAIKCVEDQLNNGKIVYSFWKNLSAALRGHYEVNEPGDTIIKCIAEHALRQDTPRVFVHKGFYHRPARGHGKGRTSF